MKKPSVIELENGLRFMLEGSNITLIDEQSCVWMHTDKGMLEILSTLMEAQRKAGVDITTEAYIEGLKATLGQFSASASDNKLLMYVLHLYMEGGDNSLITPYKMLSTGLSGEEDSDYNLIPRRSMFASLTPLKLLEKINETYRLMVSDMKKWKVNREDCEVYFLTAISIEGNVATAICFLQNEQVRIGSFVDVKQAEGIKPVVVYIISKKGFQTPIPNADLWYVLEDKSDEILTILKTQR